MVSGLMLVQSVSLAHVRGEVIEVSPDPLLYRINLKHKGVFKNQLLIADGSAESPVRSGDSGAVCWRLQDRRIDAVGQINCMLTAVGAPYGVAVPIEAVFAFLHTIDRELKLHRYSGEEEEGIEQEDVKTERVSPTKVKMEISSGSGSDDNDEQGWAEWNK